MSERRSFRIEVVLGLTTQRLLERDGLSAILDLAVYVAGHEIWTHEFAERSLWVRLADLVVAQHPELRDREEFRPPSRGDDLDDYVRGYVERARERFGSELTIEAGSGTRAESPVESACRVAGEMPLIVIEPESERTR